MTTRQEAGTMQPGGGQHRAGLPAPVPARDSKATVTAETASTATVRGG